MQPQRRAVIDVGTNSTKLLVAEVAGRPVRPLWEESEQTRLGRGFYETHRLQPEAIAKTAQAAAMLADMARSYHTVSTRIIATSAARDAVNADELVSAIRRSSGLPVEIISGDQEAEWVYQGVMSDPALAGQRLLIMDVGGGSTEFVLGEGEHKQYSRSFPLGSVRLLEKRAPSDPPAPDDLRHCRESLNDFFSREIHPVLDPLLSGGNTRPQLIGTGGAATILARMENQLDSFDRERVEAARLSQGMVSHWVERLWSLPLSERKRVIGLPKKRADVILPGVAIYEAVMRQFGFTELRVSTRGLRFAALMQTDGR